MKKLTFTLLICLSSVLMSQAQILPNFQVGLKGGVNLSSLSTDNSVFSSSNRAGYLGGLWARFGALGFNFQPEVYVTGKNVDINTSNNTSARAKFTSIDVPLLFGGKVGAFGFGGRFYAGPLFSFAINKDNSFTNAVGQAATLNYNNSNFALTAGAGIDIRKISIDLRYEAGISKQNYTLNNSTNYKTRVSLFNLSVGYAFL